MDDKTTTLRVFDDDADRLDSLSRRGESYAETFRRVLDAHDEERQTAQSGD